MTTPAASPPGPPATELLTVIASVRARPGKEQELRAALAAVVEPTTGEAGCVDYHLHQAVDDPALFYFYENWTGGEELDGHLAAPHMQQLNDAVAGLVAGPAVITRVRRIG